LSQYNFSGRGGNRDSLVPKDLATLIEIIFLLPGRAAAQVRRSAAEIFVRYYGGDLALIGEVEQNRRIQQVLQNTDASHPARVFGEAVETQSPARTICRFVQRSNVLALRRVLKFHLKTRKEVRALQTAFEATLQSSENRLFSRIVAQWQQTFQFVLSLPGTFKDVIHTAVTGVDSTLVKSLRAATRKPSRRAANSSIRYPADQKATEVQQTLEGLSLVVAAHEFCPEMTYVGWKSVRSSFGKAALQERLRCHGLPRDHADYVLQPRLWAYASGSAVEGGGARMLYLRREQNLLKRVWFPALHEQALAKSRELPDNEPWPQHIADLDVSLDDE
jgi:hypothetical protein